MFHGPRRLFLKYRASKQNSWGFGSSTFNASDVIFANTDTLFKSGSVLRIRLLSERWDYFHPFVPPTSDVLFFQAHATDLVNSFGPGGELRDYILRFTNNLDPNGRVGLGIQWPKWDPAEPKALVLMDKTLTPLIIDDDNYRTRALDYVANLSLRYPI